ncbi:MAG: AI-2E family transporter [Oscillospiraceae bacterium]|nr:AI-2E family transporter [Oscillospiraceae bacterium]
MIVIKLNWNKNYTTIAVYSLLVIIAAVLFVVFIFRFDSFASGFSWLGDIMAPIIIGIAIAYIVNPLVVMFEDKVFNRLRDGEVKVAPNAKNPEKSLAKKKKLRRTAAKALSIIISFVIVLAAIVGICIAAVPSLSKSIIDLANQLPKYIENADRFLDETFANNPDIAMFISEEFSQLSGIIQKFAEMIEPMASDIIGNLSSAIAAILVALKNVLIGFIIAIYFLFSKERLIAQSKKVLFALLKNDKCQGFLTVCSKSNNIFKKYIVSNLLDAVIIFIVMALGMALMDMPYAMLVSVVCGVTNLIPFFGPFIGAIPCGVIILLVDPIKVIWFGIYVLVLQQMDGNVIKPLLFGETVGLPAIWVLIAIIVSGGLFGIPGMLLGVPVFAVLYMLAADFVAARLKKKDMPTDTDRFYDTSEYDNSYREPESSEVSE